MFTIFTVPKAFRGITGIIQENSIVSWKSLHPDIEIVLYGDEEGIREIAEKYNCIWHPEVKKNNFGTPLLNFIFMDIQKNAYHNILCYVNSDIILLKEITHAIQYLLNIKKYLFICRRINIDLNEEIVTWNSSWEKKIHNIINIAGKVGRSDQIDCFIFPKGLIEDMPPFAVGRGGWDNWLIANAKMKKISVIDGSQFTFVIHQNHNYNHIPCSKGQLWEGPETDRNRILMGGLKNLYTIDDADWILTKNGLKKKKVSLNNLIWKFLRQFK